MVKFYSMSPYNVHDWELGNEPDVDPALVPVGSGYGCWGDLDDLNYYGGRAYGEMLKVVGPAMRAQDFAVRIWIGGLLLDSPNSTNGKPENFLRGILAAGAAPHFDVVPYHWHPSYYGPGTDYDLFFNTWSGAWGGGTIGKARYLRQLMAEFGVSKPLYLNETGFGCIEASSGPCDPPGADFFKMQAEHLVRAMTRSLKSASGWLRLVHPFRPWLARFCFVGRKPTTPALLFCLPDNVPAAPPCQLPGRG